MTDACKARTDATIDYLKRSGTVKTVVLSGYYGYSMTGGLRRGGMNWRDAKATTPEKSAEFKENARLFLTPILASGKHVIRMKDIPTMDFDMNTCFDSRPWRFTTPPTVKQACWVNEKTFYENHDQHDTVVADILKGFPSIEVFDPRPVLCHDGKCNAMEKGYPLYANGDHVNRRGAGYIFDALIKSSKALRSKCEVANGEEY